MLRWWLLWQPFVIDLLGCESLGSKECSWEATQLLEPSHPRYVVPAGLQRSAAVVVDLRGEKAQGKIQQRLNILPRRFGNDVVRPVVALLTNRAAALGRHAPQAKHFGGAAHDADAARRAGRRMSIAPCRRVLAPP